MKSIRQLPVSHILAILLLGLSSNLIAQDEWRLDPNHSTLHFKVVHMAISEVVGEFTDFSVEMSAGPDFADAEITFQATTKSIDTGVAGRDKHLRADDYFDAIEFPTIIFRSKEMKNTGNKFYKLSGELTMKGVTKSIVLDVNHLGTITRQNGSVKAGFKITGKLNRMDFGVNGGSVTVSDEVTVEGNFQMVKQ